MISMASMDAFGGFAFDVFSAKNIVDVVTVMINPSLIESSTFFFQSKLLIYYIGSKAYDVVLVVGLVFLHGRFFYF